MRKSTFFAFFTPVISFFDDVSQKILSLLNCLPIDRQQKRNHKWTCSIDSVTSYEPLSTKIAFFYRICHLIASHKSQRQEIGLKRKSPWRYFTKCPTKVLSGLWLGRASGKELLAVKNKKVQKLHFFGHKLRFLVNIPHLELKTPLLTFSYNCYTEVHAKIQRDPTGGFRNRFPGGHFFEWQNLNYLGRWTGPSPRGQNGWESPRPPSKCGRPVALFGIRRRRACLGMPTDGGSW